MQKQALSKVGCLGSDPRRFRPRRASAIFRSILVDAEELLARVTALARRACGDAPTFTPVIKLEIDILKRTVASGPQNRGCPHWSRACCLPAANARIVISRAEILDAMWGVDYAAESKRRGAQDPQPGT